MTRARECEWQASLLFYFCLHSLLSTTMSAISNVEHRIAACAHFTCVSTQWPRIQEGPLDTVYRSVFQYIEENL